MRGYTYTLKYLRIELQNIYTSLVIINIGIYSKKSKKVILKASNFFSHIFILYFKLSKNFWHTSNLQILFLSCSLNYLTLLINISIFQMLISI